MSNSCKICGWKKRASAEGGLSQQRRRWRRGSGQVGGAGRDVGEQSNMRSPSPTGVSCVCVSQQRILSRILRNGPGPLPPRASLLTRIHSHSRPSRPHGGLLTLPPKDRFHLRSPKCQWTEVLTSRLYPLSCQEKGSEVSPVFEKKGLHLINEKRCRDFKVP